MASVIGAQLYTLREHLQTPKDIASTLHKLSKLGFENVQVSAVGEIDTQELASILKNEGLACVTTHQSMDQLRDVNQCVEYHQALGCQYTAVGGFFKENATTSDWIDFCKDLNQIAAQLTPHGIKVGYHNHSHEFAYYAGNPPQRAMTLLKENLSDDVFFELDTYWVAHGGAESTDWIKQLSGKLDCVHLKDFDITDSREHLMCEVGEGNLNWPGILRGCKDAGVKWYNIERDDGLLDPFDSLKKSLDNLRAMGLQ